GIVLSPGPCTPDEAGICLEIVPAAIEAGIPLLGVCLGHQSIVQAAGGRIIQAGRLMHGRTSQIRVTGQDELFAGLPETFTATRYHSLVAEEDSLPDQIEVFARAADDNEIMACRWKGQAVWGVQFHPESIASEHGARMITNFLKALPQARTAA
ncbi:MAG: aminodeoxychorismate/anthranilate synthase component II, partial [Pseudomonadota bacterium]